LMMLCDRKSGTLVNVSDFNAYTAVSVKLAVQYSSADAEEAVKASTSAIIDVKLFIACSCLCVFVYALVIANGKRMV
jgi:hypothetical protein